MQLKRNLNPGILPKRLAKPDRPKTRPAQCNWFEVYVSTVRRDCLPFLSIQPFIRLLETVALGRRNPDASGVEGEDDRTQFDYDNSPVSQIRRRAFQELLLAGAGVAFPMLVRGGVRCQRTAQRRCIGSGKGQVDIDGCESQNIVALCDVDPGKAAHMFNRHAKAPKYADFRKMLEKEAKHIDAVIVSTPDHTHAPAAAMAIRLGKHVYCQKPLTHSVFEARVLTDLARNTKSPHR